MNLSRLSVLVIKTNEVNVEVYSGKDTKKYGFIISRFENGNYRMIVSTEPVYDDKKEAKNEGDGLVKKIKEMETSSILAQSSSSFIFPKS